MYAFLFFHCALAGGVSFSLVGFEDVKSLSAMTKPLKWSTF